MITSIREVLNLTGKPASLREIAVERKSVFPISLRNLVGAPPPGRIVSKTVSLDFLQRKLDVFFNQRTPSLFQVRINSEQQQYGQSALTLAMYDRIKEVYDHDNPVVTQKLAGPGEVLSIPGVLYGTHRIYFQDLDSDGLSVNIIPEPRPGLAIAIHFETLGGIEIKVEDGNAPNVDLTGFKIQLKMEFGCKNGFMDLVGFIDEIDTSVESAKVTNSGDLSLLTARFRDEVIKFSYPKSSRSVLEGFLREALNKRYINTDASVDVRVYPDGTVAEKLEKTFNNKIYKALKSPATRAALNAMVTRWLVGGDFIVTGVANDESSLTVNYIVPPGQLEPFPETPQAPLEPGLLANVDHIVVLMMENRSFDHMLGYLSKHGGRSDVEGLQGDEKNRYLGTDYASTPLLDTDFFESPPHSHGPVEAQINGGKMDGFAAAFAQKFPQQPAIVGRIMGYHTAEQVPVYDALAREFAICDHWFAAHPGPTFCNRFYTLTGRLNRNRFGLPETDNPHLAEFQPVNTKTLFDHLSDHGVNWHYYENRYCFLRLFERYTLDDKFIVDFNDPLKGFFASAARIDGLPAVSFIDPNFVDEPDDGDNDDGPPADIRAGQNLIGSIVNALMNGPNWQKTLLLITYDEHGGFYDHVNPYTYSANAKPVSGIDHYGVRVPTLVVSPWVDAGSVSNVVFDHTSIPKTIIRRFLHTNPPDMGERVTAANDLSQVLRSSPRTDRPMIPIPAKPQRSAFAAGLAAAAAETDDFKDIMRAMQARYPLKR
jgi:phospholipase C